jgi:hypothetical protein
MFTPETPLLTLLAGLALLLVGRRLFWLFVGLTGFFTVYRWFEPYPAGPTATPSMRWVLAILAGIVGILLAIFLQKFAVALAGFFAGGWFALQFLGLQLSHARGADLVIFVIAGVIAAILALAVFNLALIILSSLAGADLIVEALRPGPNLARIILIGLAVVGIAVQMGITARRRRE